jgi:hypothetical protein
MKRLVNDPFLIAFVENRTQEHSEYEYQYHCSPPHNLDLPYVPTDVANPSPSVAGTWGQVGLFREALDLGNRVRKTV